MRNSKQTRERKERTLVSATPIFRCLSCAVLCLFDDTVALLPVKSFADKYRFCYKDTMIEADKNNEEHSRPDSDKVNLDYR